MKTFRMIYVILLGMIGVFFSCENDEPNHIYEPGVYKPYKQEIVLMQAFTEGQIIDENLIPWTDDNLSEEAGTRWNSINLEKGSRAFINCPICLNVPWRIEVFGDSLFLKPTELNVVKFAPYDPLGMVPVADPQEAEQYATLRAKMTASELIVSTYDISIRASGFKKSTTDVNYPDLDFLKSELRDNDTLVWVKKDTYFRK